MKSTKLALVLIAVVAVMLPPSAFGEDLLKGKVQKADSPARIKRPAMPVLGATAAVDEPAQSFALPKNTSHAGGLTEDDFVLNFTRQSPKSAPVVGSVPSKKKDLAGDSEDAQLIIEWEQWHHRISEAIFQRWRTLGVFPGVARTTLTFSRDGRVDVTIHSVELPPNIYDVMMPQFRRYQLEEIRHLFQAAVEDSVMPLNGSSTVRFPERSKRTQVSITPNFSGDVDEGYNWKKDDYERVQVK
jgi:hypothetical protein